MLTQSLQGLTNRMTHTHSLFTLTIPCCQLSARTRIHDRLIQYWRIHEGHVMQTTFPPCVAGFFSFSLQNERTQWKCYDLLHLLPISSLLFKSSWLLQSLLYMSHTGVQNLAANKMLCQRFCVPSFHIVTVIAKDFEWLTLHLDLWMQRSDAVEPLPCR